MFYIPSPLDFQSGRVFCGFGVDFLSKFFDDGSMDNTEVSGDVLVGNSTPGATDNGPMPNTQTQSLIGETPVVPPVAENGVHNEHPASDVFSQIKALEATMSPQDGPQNRKIRRERETFFKKVLHEQPDDVKMRLAVENDAFRRHYLKQKGEEAITANPHDPEGVVISVTALDRKILREAHKDDPAYLQGRLEANVAGFGRTFKRELAKSHPDMAQQLAQSDPYMRSVLNGTAEDIRKAQKPKAPEAVVASPEPVQQAEKTQEAVEAWRLMDTPDLMGEAPAHTVASEQPVVAAQPVVEVPVEPPATEPLQQPIERTTWLDHALSGKPLSDAPISDEPLSTGSVSGVVEPSGDEQVVQAASETKPNESGVDFMLRHHHENDRDKPVETVDADKWLWGSDGDDHEIPDVVDVSGQISNMAADKLHEQKSQTGIVTNPKRLDRDGSFRGVAPTGLDVVVGRLDRSVKPSAPVRDLNNLDRAHEAIDLDAFKNALAGGASRAIEAKKIEIDKEDGSDEDKEKKKKRAILFGRLLLTGAGIAALLGIVRSAGDGNPIQVPSQVGGTNPAGYDSGALHMPEGGYKGPLATTIPTEPATPVPSFIAPNQPEGDQAVPLSQTVAETTPATETEIDQKIDELLRIPMVDLHIDKPGDSISQSWIDEQGKSANEYKMEYYDDYEVTTADVMYNWKELEQAWSVIGGMPINFEEYMQVVDQAKHGDSVAIERLRSVNKMILDQQDLQLPNQIFRDFASPDGAKQFYRAVDSKDTLLTFEQARERGQGVTAQAGSGEAVIGDSVNEEIGSTVASAPIISYDQVTTGGDAELGSVNASAPLPAGDGTGIAEAGSATVQKPQARGGLGGFISGLFGGGGQNRQ